MPKLWSLASKSLCHTLLNVPEISGATTTIDLPSSNDFCQPELRCSIKSLVTLHVEICIICYSRGGFRQMIWKIQWLRGAQGLFILSTKRLKAYCY